MMFRQQCEDCKAVWNAAFGIVGMTKIAEPPSKCPKCGSPKIAKFADGWEMDDGSIYPKPVVTKIGDAIVHGDRAMSDGERILVEAILEAAKKKLSETN
jgi:hypothetical protein